MRFSTDEKLRPFTVPLLTLMTKASTPFAPTIVSVPLPPLILPVSGCATVRVNVSLCELPVTSVICSKLTRLAAAPSVPAPAAFSVQAVSASGPTIVSLAPLPTSRQTPLPVFVWRLKTSVPAPAPPVIVRFALKFGPSAWIVNVSFWFVPLIVRLCIKPTLLRTVLSPAVTSTTISLSSAPA